MIVGRVRRSVSGKVEKSFSFIHMKVRRKEGIGFGNSLETSPLGSALPFRRPG